MGVLAMLPCDLGSDGIDLIVFHLSSQLDFVHV